MKDYTLSEIKAKCTGNCFKCDESNEELSKFCRRFIKTHDDYEMPRDWDIEPRDMIELPCKISVRSDNESFWQVAYRGLTRSGIVIVTDFSEESEADAFLADLKDLLNGRKR